MILQELKKIWTPMRIVLLIVISLLVYCSFLSPIVKRFEAGEGMDAFQEKLCISREWMMEYGTTIEYIRMRETMIAPKNSKNIFDTILHHDYLSKIKLSDLLTDDIISIADE